MGSIVLITAAVIEAVFGTFCIVTKSNQIIIRSWIRVMGFAIFVVSVLVSTIEWSFRWVPLSAILLIWAIIGSISLIRKKEYKKGYKTVHIVFKAAGMWLIIAAALIPAMIFPQFRLPATTGEYKVETAVYTYTDESRVETHSKTGGNRKVTVEFWYPGTAGGRYPLIVFSHGAFGIKASNSSTFRELASNGYVVCSIDHPYHSFYTIDTDGNITTVDRSFIQEVIDANNGVYDDETVYGLERKWLKLRTDDMGFVLDTIVKNARDGYLAEYDGPAKDGGSTKFAGSNAVYKLVDTEKIGLIGHSLGGAASAQIGRERTDIDAVVNLDGDLLGEYVDFVDGKPVLNQKTYPVPILSIYTDDMKQAFASAADNGQVVPQKLISTTAPNAYKVYIAGTNHMSLTDLPLFSPFLVNMISGSIKKISDRHEADKYYVIETMNNIVLKFFDSSLKGKGTFNSPRVGY